MRTLWLSDGATRPVPAVAGAVSSVVSTFGSSGRPDRSPSRASDGGTPRYAISTYELR
jgi:hypothetical protein